MNLGDKVHRALLLAGVTSSLVERWVGAECGCEERRERLNQLGRWAERIIRGRVAKAAEYLLAIMGPHLQESDDERREDR